MATRAAQIAKHLEYERICSEDFKRGLDSSKISKKLGITPSQVRAYVKSAAMREDAIADYENESLRLVELRRLNEMLAALYPLALGEKERVIVIKGVPKIIKEPDKEAGELILKIMKRVAALKGLDAPKHIDGAVTHTLAIDEQLQQLIRSKAAPDLPREIEQGTTSGSIPGSFEVVDSGSEVQAAVVDTGKR